MRHAARACAALALIVVTAVVGGRVAHATTADNGQTNITVSGPASASIGQTVTYTAVIAGDTAGVGNLDLLPGDLTVAIPAGAENITITDSDAVQTCAQQFFAFSPVSYVSCQGYFVPADGSVTLTISLTLTEAAAPNFTLSATVISSAVGATASQTTSVGVANTSSFASTNFSAPPYSGANFDPRCEFGCGPGGLP